MTQEGSQTHQQRSSQEYSASELLGTAQSDADVELQLRPGSAEPLQPEKKAAAPAGNMKDMHETLRQVINQEGYGSQLERAKMLKKRKEDALLMERHRDQAAKILETVRKYKTKNATKMLEMRKSEAGNTKAQVKKLNSFIFDQHDRLRLKKRCDDPNISDRAFEMTVDLTEFDNVKKKAD